MLQHKYIIVMNSKYMNTFESYLKAYEYMEILQRRFPRAQIEIEPYYY